QAPPAGTIPRHSAGLIRTQSAALSGTYPPDGRRHMPGFGGQHAGFYRPQRTTQRTTPPPLISQGLNGGSRMGGPLVSRRLAPRVADTVPPEGPDYETVPGGPENGKAGADPGTTQISHGQSHGVRTADS